MFRILHAEGCYSLKIPAIMDTLAGHMRSEHNVAFGQKEKVLKIAGRMKDH